MTIKIVFKQRALDRFFYYYPRQKKIFKNDHVLTSLEKNVFSS